jgi:ligand-binding sensor domain-containing protein
MVIRKQLYSLFIFLLLTGMGHAQWREMRLSFLGTEHGLHSAIYDMAQDSAGYMYFATNTGMYRYDGHNFEFFGHDPKNANSNRNARYERF